MRWRGAIVLGKLAKRFHKIVPTGAGAWRSVKIPPLPNA
jgi:hypothetical protein